MFMKKILVAGLAVVGMVGMASAQAPTTPNPSPILANALGGTAPTGQMTVSYSVSLQAEMDVVDAGLSGDALLVAIDPTTDDNYKNLGTVKVKTNYPYWDVSIEAENNLTLADGGTPAYQGVWVPNDFGGGSWVGGTAAVPGTPLLASGLAGGTGGTAPVTAKLSVYIGIRNDANTGWLTSKRIDATSQLSLGSASIAYVAGTALTTAGASDVYHTQTGTDISTKGFIPPVDPDNGVTFYLSACFDAATRTSGIKGQNKDGDYTETLTFTMMAGF